MKRSMCHFVREVGLVLVCLEIHKAHVAHVRTIKAQTPKHPSVRLNVSSSHLMMTPGIQTNQYHKIGCQYVRDLTK